MTPLVIAVLTGTAAALGALVSRDSRRPEPIPVPVRSRRPRRA